MARRQRRLQRRPRNKLIRHAVGVVVVAAAVTVGCENKPAEGETKSAAPTVSTARSFLMSEEAPAPVSAPLRMASGALGNKGIPDRYIKSGDDLSPPLSWEGGPTGTKCYALVAEEVPDGRVLWVAWNIPGEKKRLAEAERAPGEGTNDYGDLGYGGPLRAESALRVRLMALEEVLELESGARAADLEAAVRGHVLESVERVFGG